MAATGINIEHVVEIDTTIEATLPRSEFGTGLMLTTNSTLDAGGNNKCVRFDNSAAVSTYFGADSDLGKDAGVWFAADPRPKALYIGRWANEAVGTVWISGPITAAATDFPDSGGSMRIGEHNIVGMDFSSASDYNDVAGVMQTAIQGVAGNPFNNATVTYADNRITIDFAAVTTDVGDITAARDSNTGAVIGTDITGSNLLNFADGRKRLGSAAEDLAAAVGRCVALADSGAPVALMLDRSFPTNESNTRTSITAMRQVAQGGDYMYAFVDTSDTAKETLDTTTEMYLAEQASANKVIAVYSDDPSKRSDIAILAKLSAQDFDQPQSIITLVPKELRGVETSVITSDELTAILGKNGSVLTTVDGRPTLLGGRTSNGSWADSQWWITWLKNEMEVSIFNGLRNSTRFNNAILVSVINSVMQKAVRSGGARPGGVVSDAIKHDIRTVTGNRDFDGILSSGYLLWVANPNTQTTVDRGNRVSDFKVWIAPSDAIQSVDGTIVLSSG